MEGEMSEGDTTDIRNKYLLYDFCRSMAINSSIKALAELKRAARLCCLKFFDQKL